MIVSVSVALLLDGSGSAIPLGAVIVAVLMIVPRAPKSTFVDSVYATLPPTGRFTASLIFPAPDAAQLAPPVAVQVHVAFVSAEGRTSATVAPLTA